MYSDPFEEMQREMNRLFSSYSRRTPYAEARPAMDMMDKGKELVVIVDLPGVRKEDIDINCTGDYLEITAKSSDEVVEKEEGYYLSERSASAFKRGVSLPVEVYADKAKSSFKNGVLEIHLPKKGEHSGHKIKID